MSSIDKITELLIKNNPMEAIKCAQAALPEHAGNEKQHGLLVAKAAAAAYRQFIHQPVGEFVKAAPKALPEESAQIVEKGFSRLFENSKKWMRTVESVREERLSRDLMDSIRFGDNKGALHKMSRILSYSKNTDESRKKRASYIGSVIGSVISREKEAAKIVQYIIANPDKLGLTEEQAHIMEESRQNRRTSIAKAGLDNLETQWYTIIKTAQTDILNEFPPKNQMGEPEEEDLKKIGDIFRDILRPALIKNDQELFIDASIILLDFCPRETSLAARRSGIEGRSYDEIGFTAKKTAGLSFLEIGTSEVLTKQYEAWSHEQLDGPYADPVIELMGAFRNDVFAPLLLDLLQDKKRKELHGDILDALSNLTSPNVAKYFLTELQRTIKGSRTIDAKVVRDANRYIEGLGKIVKSPRTEENTRSAIFENTIKIIPKSSTQLTLSAVTEIISAKPSQLDDNTKRWAVDVLVNTIWIPQQTSGLEQTPDPKAGTLGKRYPYVKALSRFTKSSGDFIVQEISGKVSRYSPAFIAAAEVLEKIQTDQSSNALKSMIQTTLHFDERQLVEHQMEKFYDDANETYKPISQDIILYSLCYALVELDKEATKPTLEEVLSAIRSNTPELVGNQTLDFLTKELGVSAFEKTSQDNISRPSTQKPKITYDAAEVKELVKKLRARYLLSAKKKLSEKVSALARLGEIAPPEALDAVLEQLHEKDSMIQSAAAQTISSYMNPEMHETIRQDVLFQCLQGLLSSNENYKEGCKAALKAMNPNRRDIRPEIVKFGHSVNNGSVRLSIQEILGGTFLEDESSSVSPNTPLPVAEGEEGEVQEARAPSGLQKMQMKRDYFAARKAWIDGGKQGQEPKKPDGI